ncbi:PKD domain-containing protein [Candidatus Woesearchaeota archaeon]|nr:PKD domain-containing protein [Candidatus Woesearchaeota archaeon]
MNLNKIDLKKSSFALPIFAIAIFILILFIFPIISASFSVGNPNRSLETVYGPSGNITGWINISFSSEPWSSVFMDSRGNSANLSVVLKNNGVYRYSCSPIDCKEDYTASDGSTTKTETLNFGNSKTYGIKLTGNVFSIDSFGFVLDSNAAASCTNQIEVDFLDDSVLDARNKNSLDSGSCINQKNYGCFDSGQTMEEFTFPTGTTPYCEKVNLSSSPGFFIGGWIKKMSGSRTLKASIYDTAGGGEIANCILPNGSSSGGEVSCNVSYSVTTPKEHYVCISATSGSGDYKTRGYSTTNGCGFYGTPVPSTTPAAYQIFAQGKQFGAVGSMGVNKSVSNGRTFAELAEEYLTEKYGTKDCSSGCVIPLSIKSNFNQNITIKNLQVNYQKESGIVTENNFYEVQTTPAKVTSGFQRLYLDGSGFSVPANLGNSTFSLRLNGQGVISEKIEVKDIPIIKSVSPTNAASAYPTEFTVSVTSKYNLTGFSWDFGDNSQEITTLVNKASHAYNSVGVYNLMVRVIDQRGLSALRVFMINVSSPKELINSSLYDAEKDISNLEEEISTFPQFYQDSLNLALNLDSAKQKVVFLKSAYQNATSEAEYSEIVAEIIELNIPEGIAKSKSAQDLTLFSGPDYVNLPVLQEIAGGNYSSEREEDYVNAVLLWKQENLETKVDFNEFSGRYTGYVEPITRIFEIKVGEKKDIPYDYYLIIPEMDGFATDADYNTQSGYIYINIKEDNSVSFSTTEDVDFTNLNAFISPAISRLAVAEESIPEEKPKWTVFILVVFLLLVIGFVVYIIMQEWYRRRYENYLFKNKNDLYNMVNYVNNAKRKGLKNTDIEENLKKAGWSSERIRYVMRKYAGRRTGMLEIPITKLTEKVGGKPKNQK